MALLRLDGDLATVRDVREVVERTIEERFLDELKEELDYLRDSVNTLAVTLSEVLDALPDTDDGS